jgi:hypothetical protein
MLQRTPVLARHAFFALVMVVGQVVFPVAGRAMTLDPVSVGTSYFLEGTQSRFDFPSSTWVTQVVASGHVTSGLEPGPISLAHWDEGRLPLQTWREERRGWAAFEIPDGLSPLQGASLTGTYDWPGIGLGVRGVSGPLPGIGDSVTGMASDAIFGRLAGGASYGSLSTTYGAGTSLLGGSIVADILSREGGLLYLGFVLPNQFNLTVSNLKLNVDAVVVTPLPAAAWLFITGLAGLLGARRLNRPVEQEGRLLRTPR